MKTKLIMSDLVDLDVHEEIVNSFIADKNIVKIETKIVQPSHSINGNYNPGIITIIYYQDKP